MGKTDIDDALKRLDKLTQEEVRMATAQLLKLTRGVDDKVTRIDDDVKGINGKVKDIGDTVKLVLDSAQCVIFSSDSVVTLYLARWKRNKSNCTADSKRCNGIYATYGK